MKGTLIYSMRAKQEGRASSRSTSAGNTHFRCLPFFTILHVSVNDRESATSIDFEVTNTFWRVGKFTNTVSSNNEDQRHICANIHIPSDFPVSYFSQSARVTV